MGPMTVSPLQGYVYGVKEGVSTGVMILATWYSTGFAAAFVRSQSRSLPPLLLHRHRDWAVLGELCPSKLQPLIPSL